ncbi:hypothetical protein [Ruegeria lacuscaerulensis]|uniref:hypothetical protein n=1 Tax=Ruegeria lacuscaerulensis TaxID=55218 RepID=UPI00147E4D10|nr:hypothetical protein [Ruegeria lacuscaerulensis]
MAGRRKRSDSIAAEQERAQARMGNFPWPTDLVALPIDTDHRERVLAVADRVWQTRMPDDWLSTDTAVIAEYARVQVQILIIQEQMDSLGVLIKSKDGTPQENPLVSIEGDLSRRRMALARALHLHLAIDPRNLINNRPRQYHEPLSKPNGDAKNGLPKHLRGLIQ